MKIYLFEFIFRSPNYNLLNLSELNYNDLPSNLPTHSNAPTQNSMYAVIILTYYITHFIGINRWD